eukprot:sb/3471478/
MSVPFLKLILEYLRFLVRYRIRFGSVGKVLLRPIQRNLRLNTANFTNQVTYETHLGQLGKVSIVRLAHSVLNPLIFVTRSRKLRRWIAGLFKGKRVTKSTTSSTTTRTVYCESHYCIFFVGGLFGYEVTPFIIYELAQRGNFITKRSLLANTNLDRRYCEGGHREEVGIVNINIALSYHHFLS